MTERERLLVEKANEQFSNYVQQCSVTFAALSSEIVAHKEEQGRLLEKNRSLSRMILDLERENRSMSKKVDSLTYELKCSDWRKEYVKKNEVDDSVAEAFTNPEQSPSPKKEKRENRI